MTAKIYYNGQLVSSPRVQSLANDPILMEVSGRGQTKLQWKVELFDTHMVQVPNGIEIKTAIDYSTEDHIFRAQPHLIVSPGKEASFQSGDNQGNTLEIKVVANRI